jgi:hypothetical protein
LHHRYENREVGPQRMPLPSYRSFYVPFTFLSIALLLLAVAGIGALQTRANLPISTLSLDATAFEERIKSVIIERDGIALFAYFCLLAMPIAMFQTACWTISSGKAEKQGN